MTVWWVVSYAVLWFAIAVLSALTIGAMRQIGALRIALGMDTPTRRHIPPSVKEVGPPIGATLQPIDQESFNAWGRISLPARERQRRTLVTFLAPTCTSCQSAVDALNRARERYGDVDFVAIIVGIEPASRAFLNIFPLRMPAICDDTRLIANSFGVNVNPFTLLYDASGKLCRKARLAEAEDVLRALLEERSSDLTDDIFPALHPTLGPSSGTQEPAPLSLA